LQPCGKQDFRTQGAAKALLSRPLRRKPMRLWLTFHAGDKNKSHTSWKPFLSVSLPRSDRHDDFGSSTSMRTITPRETRSCRYVADDTTERNVVAIPGQYACSRETIDTYRRLHVDGRTVPRLFDRSSNGASDHYSATTIVKYMIASFEPLSSSTI